MSAELSVNTLSCGCRLGRSDRAATFVFCPLHVAAPDLLDALRQVWQWTAGEIAGTPLDKKIAAAIAKATGTEATDG